MIPSSLQVLKDQKIVYLVKVIAAIVFKCDYKNEQGFSKFSEMIEYVEFDSEINSSQHNMELDRQHQSIIGVIPVSNIYAVYAIFGNEVPDKLLGYYLKDEHSINNINWMELYDKEAINLLKK
jgi:hypothetical protein